jgi:transcriptional regulator with XRE-family HTH domain
MTDDIKKKTDDIKLMPVEEIRRRLEDKRLSYVAEKCGLTYMSLSRIRKKNGNPSVSTLQSLSQYFQNNE